MPMDELPGAGVGPEDARRAQRERRDLLAAADLRLEPLDLEDARELRCYVPHHFLEADRPALAVVRCGPLPGLDDLAPTAGRRTERVREGRVFPLAVELEEATGITPCHLVERSVALFDCSIEVIRCHHCASSLLAGGLTLLRQTVLMGRSTAS